MYPKTKFFSVCVGLKLKQSQSLTLNIIFLYYTWPTIPVLQTRYGKRVIHCNAVEFSLLCVAKASSVYKVFCFIFIFFLVFFGKNSNNGKIHKRQKKLQQKILKAPKNSVVEGNGKILIN